MKKIKKFSGKWNRYFSVLLLLLAPAVCFIGVEWVVENSILNMQLPIIFFNYAIYLSVFLLLYTICNRIDVSVSIGTAFFCGCGLFNSYIYEIRGYAIRTADLFSVQTAANVAGGYPFQFTVERVMLILGMLLLIYVSLHCCHVKGTLKKRILMVCICITYFVALGGFMCNKEFLTSTEIRPYQIQLVASAKDHGALLDFIAGIPFLTVEEPEGYSEQKAEELIEAAQTDGESKIYKSEENRDVTPDLIVVMNESFSDLSVLGDVETDQEYLPFFHALSENTVKGNISVPVLGGLTANTEFEFLTGFSEAFLPTGLVSFQTVVKSTTPNLNRWLQEQGYYSMFMHPMDSNGWNRADVYQLFGFDAAYYLEDYHNQELLRGHVSDSSNYKEVIQRYEEAKAENDHVFLFNVTMQNHGGYETDYEDTVHLLNLEGNYPQTEEFLSLMKESDQAFQELIDYFSDKEDPVLICMFGDHQPLIETEFYEEVQATTQDSELMKLAKKYQTPFVIYANYDIEEARYENLSANYLQNLLLETAGLPLNEFQKYLDSLYEEYPVINMYGVMDQYRQWYSWDEAVEFQRIKEYSIVQYKEVTG